MIEALDSDRRSAAASSSDAGEPPAAARAMLRAVPAVADGLLAQHPGRIHREIVTLIERVLIAHVLDRFGGNQLRAARALGLNRNTLRKRCHDLGLLPRASPARRHRLTNV